MSKTRHACKVDIGYDATCGDQAYEKRDGVWVCAHHDQLFAQLEELDTDAELQEAER